MSKDQVTTLTFESELKIVSVLLSTCSLVAAALYIPGKEMQKPIIIANRRIETQRERESKALSNNGLLTHIEEEGA